MALGDSLARFGPGKAEGRRLKAESDRTGPDGSAPIQPSAFCPQPSRSHRDLADAGGGRSDCPGGLRRGRQQPSERAVGICASWQCRACGASIGLDRTTGAVTLDTSRAETMRGLMR